MTYVSALRAGGICAAMALLSTVAGGALAAPKIVPEIVPKIVPRPAAGATCHVPSSADTQFFQLPAKTGPCRVALANSCIANTWRIQLIQTAKACAAQPEVATDLKKLMVVPTGEDVAAQVSAINTFIEPGYDAIIVNAQNPQAFTPVIKRAKQASVVLAAFDNTLDPKNAIDVNVDQTGIGTLSADWLIDHIANGGKVPEVRGVIGTSVNTDRHNGTHDALAASGTHDALAASGKNCAGRVWQELGHRRGRRQMG
jgi:ribose transport system substrate-binding protein